MHGGGRGTGAGSATRTIEAGVQIASTGGPRHALRADIQALRAVAVLAVLAYHLWPERLRGGFVGVDIFFVISGYLITSHLIGAPPRRPRDFVRFWGRRVQRLIPAAALVIFAVLVTTYALLPQSRWRAVAHDAVASMFYYQNWHLIAQSTDYLSVQREPSPFEHFWSLGVEEQFYIVWPFLVAALAAAIVVFRTTHPRRFYAAGFAAVIAVSLWLSVTMSWNAPAEAYFSAFTRMWELGAGGLLAALTPAIAAALADRPGVRVVLLWAGAAGIAVSVLVISQAWAFPGWIALAPTVSAVAVILAGDPAHRLNPRALIESRPVQMVGDCSYAIYLWHWPLIVIAPYVLDHPLGRADKIAVALLGVLVGWASTRLFEAPIRNAGLLRGRLWRVYAVGALCSLIVLGGAGGIVVTVNRAELAAQHAVAQHVDTQATCFGAAALDPSRACPQHAPLVTTPAFAKEDVPDGITQCLNWAPYKAPAVVCKRGELQNPTKRIALFGNSHAGQWLPAFEETDRKRGWEVDTYAVAGCWPFAGRQYPTPGAIKGYSVADLTMRCERFLDQLIAAVDQGHYDLVVVAALDQFPQLHKAQYEQLLTGFAQSAPRVLVLRDTPSPADVNNQPPDCVGRHLADTAACDGSPAAWIHPDPIAEAARSLDNPAITVADLNDHICLPERCPAVIGGVIVYFDFNHLSATYVRTLAPYLAPILADQLR